MVVWTNLFPADPVGGLVNGYGRVVASTPPFNQPWGYYGAPYYLTSPGTVDVQIPTRFQYMQADPVAVGYPLSVWGAFIFDATDVSNAAGRAMAGTAFAAPASAFAANYTPTPAEIIAASTLSARTSNTRTTAGNIKSVASLPPPSTGWSPNTKWWVVMVPTFSSGGAPNTDVPAADANSIGRALSFWTNRTPEKPVILSPSTLTARPGSIIQLPFKTISKDAITSFSGDLGKNDFDDIAGIQVQYAEQPSAANPDPVWTDLPFSALDPTHPDGGGWYIDGTVRLGAVDDLGVYYAWLAQKITIQCGAGLVGAAGQLESGKWQIRMRTFDYGHQFPNSTGVNPWLGGAHPPALWDTSGNFQPSTYPAVNTSPWSDPVKITISEQVPAPLPVSPANNVAVVLNATPITLVWQYRNTYTPPFTQGWRSVQIRKVGDPDWTSLVTDQSSDLTTFGLIDYPFSLVSGNHYEWRVQTMDASGARSPWSEPAQFWLVPEPQSGEVIPVPSDTIDGATLGCGIYRVEVYRRGGLTRVAEIKNVASIEWNRLRDDISDATITITDWDIDCGNLLASLQTWAYEIVLFRENGYSVERVWEGPITLLTYENDKVVIKAKDVMAYAYRRIVKQDMNDTGKAETAGRAVTARAAAVLQNSLGRNDPNVLAYMVVIEREDDAKQYRALPAYSRTAFEEVDDMAANAGLDYTALGRSIILWGTRHRIGTLPEFTDRDLGASPIVSEYGMSMANVYAVSDGNGVYGEADRLDEFGDDPVYGLVEMLSSTWASDSESETGTYTEAGLAKVRESFAESAERSIESRYPPPVVVRVPDNTRINPDAVVSIQHLVPGVIIPLRSTGTLREVVANQKLDSIKGVVKAGEETITITMSPFNRDDSEIVEGEE